MTGASRLLVALFVAIFGTTALTAVMQSDTSPVTYTAQAVNLEAPQGRATGPVDIQITRWSSDADRDRLVNTVLERGPDKLLEELTSLPRVGAIKTPDTVGYDLRYARRSVVDGVEQVVIITDRPVGYWERASASRSVDYPFTVIELRINPNGQGEGRLSVATRVNVNKTTKMIELENYTVSPVLLQNVRRAPGPVAAK